MAVQKIRIKLAAYDHELVDEAASRIVETMKKSGAKISGPIPLPTEREIVTILRSPHKYKDSREQFEMRTYKRIIDIYSPNAKLLDSIHLADTLLRCSKAFCKSKKIISILDCIPHNSRPLCKLFHGPLLHSQSSDILNRHRTPHQRPKRDRRLDLSFSLTQEIHGELLDVAV